MNDPRRELQARILEEIRGVTGLAVSSIKRHSDSSRILAARAAAIMRMRQAKILDSAIEEMLDCSLREMREAQARVEQGDAELASLVATARVPLAADDRETSKTEPAFTRDAVVDAVCSVFETSQDSVLVDDVKNTNYLARRVLAAFLNFGGMSNDEIAVFLIGRVTKNFRSVMRNARIDIVPRSGKSRGLAQKVCAKLNVSWDKFLAHLEGAEQRPNVVRKR